MNDLSAAFRVAVGAANVLDDSSARLRYAQDVYRSGALPLAVVRPENRDQVVAAIITARRHGLGVHVRGGGMSYTDACTPAGAEAIVLDMSRMDRVVHVAAEDLYVTVEPACTWAALDAALATHGLRAVFWGPMSGRVATVGGAMSQGAVTFGSGRNGPSASAALSFEIVTGDGRVLRTGADGQPGHLPFFRHYGPDFTGLFTGDAGALGVKTAITLQLEPRPACGDGLSFSFVDFDELVQAVATVSRHGLATEVFGAQSSLVELVTGGQTLADGLAGLRAVARAQRHPWRAMVQLARIARHGRRFLDGAKYTASFLTEAPDNRRLRFALDDLRKAVGTLGIEIPNTMAAVTRATPFPDPLVLGPEGRRLLPLHGILPYSRVTQVHEAFTSWLADRQSELTKHDVLVFLVYATSGRGGFLYEPVIYWRDSWPELHQEVMPAQMLERWQEPSPAPAARMLVEQIRCELVDLLYRHGAVHLQIGRSYPWSLERDPGALDMFDAIKTRLDPAGLVNPGALMGVSNHQPQSGPGA